MKFTADFKFIEVPFSFHQEVDSSPHALIDIQVGTEIIQLAIDTGSTAAPIMVSTDVLRQVNASYTGRTQENYDALGQKYESKEFVLTNVSVGGLVLEEVTGVEFLFPFKTPGIIGMPFLRYFNVLMDYPNQKFGLYRKDIIPKYLSSPKWKKVKLESPCPGIVMPVKFKDYKETFFFLLDSPSTFIDAEKRSYDFIRAKSPLGQLLLQEEAVELFSIEPGILGKFCSDQFRTLCGNALVYLEFVLFDSKYPKWDALLGYHFLNMYSVFIDFHSDVLYLKPITT